MDASVTHCEMWQCTSLLQNTAVMLRDISSTEKTRLHPFACSWLYNATDVRGASGDSVRVTA